MVQEFEVGHYNLRMLRASQILVRTIALVWGAAVVAGCGQRGPLYLPTEPAAAQRATLPQTLNPAPTAASPAAAPAAMPASSPASTPRP
ncbi:LPS translocon maturation chaperone LptM [Paracidovorax wautersii]|uniref:LPS translocon maturation chaperone LptM n=1 Tax=Paracidovorax wautersii TaxID=1177982 RepID=UPI00286C087C|nr:lipoprotein [Paracidovorax wautersii]